MQEILKILDLDNHPFIVKEIEFITAVFNQNKDLLSHSNGFNLVFYKQSESIKNEFSEKEFYPLKIEKLKKSFFELEKIKLIESLSNIISNSDNLTKKLLSKQELSEADITLYKNRIGDLDSVFEFEEQLKILKSYFTDLKNHFPKFEIGKMHESWEIQMNQSALCKMKSEVGVELLKIPFGNYLYIPINENLEIRTVYTGFKPFSKIGSGNKEYWQKENGVWKVIHSSQTWIS
jgi:hypothetical protein